MEDITDRRSLREVLPSKNKLKLNPIINGNPPAGDMSIAVSGRRRGPKILLWLIIVVLMVFGLIIFSSVFSKVTVNLVPRQGRIILENETIVAHRAASSNQLEFGLVTDEIIEEITVPATGTKAVERKAGGQITIFNNFDAKSQELVANTRFETPDNKIYRIQKPVTVPGLKKIDGQSVPGSIDVDVLADKPGETYNIGLTDFTIPGFIGDPRFEGFFAKSKTPMTGGFVGNIKTVSTEDEKTARLALRQKLISQADKLKPQVPKNFILFDDALLLTFKEIPIQPDQNLDSNEVKIAEKAVATGILFDQKELSAYLARQLISDYNGEEVMIINFDELEFTLNDKTNIDPQTVNQISFSLTGNAHLVWVVDTDTFRDSIRGLNKAEFQNIITRFPVIESVILKFRPPWKKTIPDNPAKIKINMSIAE